VPPILKKIKKLVKLHKVSKEILYHFQCGECTKWWTIADHHLLLEDTDNWVSCPHCGQRHKTIEKSEELR
jgi:Zn finger protein HypA/HybF involved in hydrogenase expression